MDSKQYIEYLQSKLRYVVARMKNLHKGSKRYSYYEGQKFLLIELITSEIRSGEEKKTC